MLKIRDLGINIIPAMMPPPGNTRGYVMGYQDYGGYADMDGSNTCQDMSCGGEEIYRKPTKKSPAKKAPAKKPSKKAPSKKGSKKSYRAAGFGAAAIAQLGRQLDEQLRDIQ
ncbi:MAG TPA: hypothetical protein VI670_00245 [Thermoanaerobaculia bacterium]|jgi:hypothetical protein